MYIEDVLADLISQEKVVVDVCGTETETLLRQILL